MTPKQNSAFVKFKNAYHRFVKADTILGEMDVNHSNWPSMEKRARQYQLDADNAELEFRHLLDGGTV